MPIYDLFSKRERRARGDAPDVYRYDEIPSALRVQIVHIVRDALGDNTGGWYDAGEAYTRIRDSLAREFGWFRLTEDAEAPLQLVNFILNTKEHKKLLDAIEFTFQVIENTGADASYQYRTRAKVAPAEAIAELNGRFREHAVGYEFASGRLMRVDSQLVHAEVVKPALHLLTDKAFQGANKEFLSAHEHYQHGRYEETISDCLKALESTLKAICHARRWQYDQTDTAKKLLDIVFANGLVPAFLQAEFGALRSTLESGVPTVRNKQGGHGQGTQLRNVPRHLASFQLHLAAANIVLLVEAHRALP